MTSLYSATLLAAADDLIQPEYMLILFVAASIFLMVACYLMVEGAMAVLSRARKKRRLP